MSLKEKTKKIPPTSGVYFFLGPKNKILYIGKATNLHNRVRSYFDANLEEKRSPLIAKMISEAKNIKIETTDSVLEALILESALIKKFQPPYNTDAKDQKSWNWVVITDEEFPRVLVVREHELQTLSSKLQASFGPYTNSSQLKEALKIVRKIFPFRDRCLPAKPLPLTPSPKGRGNRACFNYQLGLCPGVCTGEISAKDYARNIRHIKLFFERKKKKLIIELTKEMKTLAKNQDFENAGKIKKQIFALQHIQDISLIKSDLKSKDYSLKTFRIEAYDIAHTSGKDMVGVMVVLENGEPNKAKYRLFNIKGQTGADDTRALREVLERRLKHSEWTYPDLLVIDGGIAQLNTALDFLQNQNLKINAISVVKDERHKQREIIGLDRLSATYKQDKSIKIQNLEKQVLLANNEAHRFATTFHKKRRAQTFLPKR